MNRVLNATAQRTADHAAPEITLDPLEIVGGKISSTERKIQHSRDRAKDLVALHRKESSKKGIQMLIWLLRLSPRVPQRVPPTFRVP